MSNIIMLCAFAGCMGLGSITYTPDIQVDDIPHVKIHRTSLFSSQEGALLAVEGYTYGTYQHIPYVIIETGSKPFSLLANGVLVPQSTGYVGDTITLPSMPQKPIGVLMPIFTTTPQYLAFPFKKQSLPYYDGYIGTDKTVITDQTTVGKNTSLPPELMLEIPFTSQAPDGDWSVPFDEACEEASVLMVDAYYRDVQISHTIISQKIRDMVQWHIDNGIGVDTDMYGLARIANEYLGYQTTIYEGGDATLEHIRSIISQGHPVILPVAGQLLENPYFSGDGPAYHVIVIVGYDEKGFYAHDPGTKRGESFYYTNNIIDNAWHDRAGSKETILEGPRRMLVMNNI